MTPDTTRLRALLARATLRPWVHYNEVFRSELGPGRVTEIQTAKRYDGRRQEIVSWSGFDGLPPATERRKNANAALIVEAINALPALLTAADEAERLRGENERLRVALSDIARQTTFDEFTAADFNNGIDFEGGYDGCIERARQALKDTQP